MWILTQDRTAFLKVDRFKFLPSENGNVRISAILPHETIKLAEYNEQQADSVLGELFYNREQDLDNAYAMPARSEEFE